MQATAHPRGYEKRSLATGHFYLKKKKYKLFQILEKSGVFYPGRMDCENNEKYSLERQSKEVYVCESITFHFSSLEINCETSVGGRNEE